MDSLSIGSYSLVINNLCKWEFKAHLPGLLLNACFRYIDIFWHIHSLATQVSVLLKEY